MVPGKLPWGCIVHVVFSREVLCGLSEISHQRESITVFSALGSKSLLRPLANSFRFLHLIS